jgi:hypothetical protein
MGRGFLISNTNAHPTCSYVALYGTPVNKSILVFSVCAEFRVTIADA